MGNSEEEFGEQMKGELSLVGSVHEPLLLDLGIHLTLFVEWEEYLVDSLHQSFVLLFRNGYFGKVALFIGP